jgi:transposase
MVKKRRSFSREFKLEAVGLMTEGGVSIAKASRDLGIRESVLGRWKKQFEEAPQEAFPGKGRLRPQDEELARLRKENEILRQERDILKKAVGIFSRVPK